MSISSKNSEIFTREFVASKLSLIFDHAIILDSKFCIVAVSECAAELLKCTPEDLTGKSLNCLAKEFNLVEDVSQLLKSGYFPGERFELNSIDGKILKVRLSGIHLGFISDFNESIVLTIKDLNPTHQLTEKLKMKEAIIENLVYRASHDLRGPIATILGLVNVSKVRMSDTEVDKLFELIDIHIKLLDRRLNILVKKAAAKELRIDSRF